MRAVILLGDQPGVTPEAIRAIVQEYERTVGRVVRALYAGRSGHPVLLDRRVWTEIEALEGDRGARPVGRSPRVDRPRGGVREPSPDVDTWDEYEGPVRPANE